MSVGSFKGSKVLSPNLSAIKSSIEYSSIDVGATIVSLAIGPCGPRPIIPFITVGFSAWIKILVESLLIFVNLIMKAVLYFNGFPFEKYNLEYQQLPKSWM